MGNGWVKAFGCEVLALCASAAICFVGLDYLYDVIKYLIKSYRQFFGVSDDIRDGVVLFRLLFFIVVSLLLGIQIGYCFF